MYIYKNIMLKNLVRLLINKIGDISIGSEVKIIIIMQCCEITKKMYFITLIF
jgi:hypothetical protein